MYAWLFKRINGDPDTPRRLVYCLPMRVLVEQTESAVSDWLNNTGCQDRFAVHLVMGGEDDLKSWTETPEREVILIGTQDMLLSRALMRGYGMSRYRWPVDFALVHNDALWAFDEVQLMGAGLPTSAQLEAFRRRPEFPLGRDSHSIWVSATLNRSWLETIDFRPFLDAATTRRLSREESGSPAIRRRREAVKNLAFTGLTLEGEGRAQVDDYIERLAEKVCSSHSGDGPTIVILNRVERTQRLSQEIRKRMADRPGIEHLLVHARFRQQERTMLNERIRSIRPDSNIIVVATQAIEAGVDITSKTLFTEIASWPSLVQRFGRCNRGGEFTEARVFWMDMAGDEKLAAPYEPGALKAAREQLRALETQSVAPANLPAVTEEAPIHHVLRRKDLLDLFNTNPDLSGFDIDISPYLRDAGAPQLQVFWREFDARPNEQPAPGRNELCPVSIGQIREHAGKDRRRIWRWDTLGRRWVALKQGEIRPGQVLMLRCSDGGYSVDLGFMAKHKDRNSPVTDIHSAADSGEAYDDDRWSEIGRFVPLSVHLADVALAADELCRALEETRHSAPVVKAARWHDVGKAHPAFQAMLLVNGATTAADDQLWAKSDGTGSRLRLSCMRKHFRHELASLLAWLEYGDEEDEVHDLIAYLIAAHHGKVRMSLRALPDEPPATDGQRFARGVWEGDALPAFDFDGEHLPETRLRLDVMELGDGAMGPSWTARTQGLLMVHGPFLLAWLEMLVRVADWRASAAERDAS